MKLIRAKGIYDAGSGTLSDRDGLAVGEDGRIEAIGNFAAMVRENPGVPVLDCRGKYLFPGLINTHVHLEFDGTVGAREHFINGDPRLRFLMAARNAVAMLRSGVTTLRDAGSSWDLLSLLYPAASALTPLPRLQLAGPPLTVTGGHLHFQGGEADSPEELVKAVRERGKRGCGALKLVVTGGQMTPGSLPERTSYTPEHIRAATEEAGRLGLPTFSHCLTVEGMLRSLEGGVESLEHCACFERNRENGLLERVYCPEALEPWRGAPVYFMNGIACSYREFDHCRGKPERQTAREAFLLEQERRECEIFGRLADLGWTPVLGTDAGVHHTSFDESWLELELLVERCGLSPAEAIATGTTNAAACLGMEGEVGRLEKGFFADLIVLEENPLHNIRAFRSPAQVLLGGEPVGAWAAEAFGDTANA